MRLNTDQVAVIKDFISKRGFKEQDLQLEILDHLTCKIEDLMSENADVGFEDALGQAHAQFGVMGLSVLEDSMRTSISHTFKQISLNVLKKWITFPNWIAVLGLSCVLFLFFTKLEENWSLVSAILIQLVFVLLTLFIQFRRSVPKRNMLILKSLFPYSYLPIFVLQVQINVLRPLMEKIEYFPMQPVLLVVILFWSVLNFHIFLEVHRYAIRRCEELEATYGSLTIG